MNAVGTRAADEDRGLVHRKLEQWFGRSWRTTLLGALTLLCGVIVTVPGMPPDLVEIAKYLLAPASGLGIMLAKDQRVSGVPPEAGEPVEAPPEAPRRLL